MHISRQPPESHPCVCPLSPTPVKPAPVSTVCRLIDSFNLDGCNDDMDVNHSDLETSDMDTDQEPDHSEYDEPEPMEGIEYFENLCSAPPISQPTRRPSTLRNHISSRPRPSRTPDRFVFDRTLNVQPRERFMLSTPPQELSANERWSRRQSHAHDAFGSKTKVPRNPNLTKFPVIARAPRPPSSFMSSRVNPLGLATPENPREISQGAVWNVGGSSPAHPVDGVRSTSDGRGGHITSGTNAPMFRSDFCNHVRDDTDHLHMHGKRLGAAMQVDQANRVLDQGSGLLTPVRSPDPNATCDCSPAVWRNNEWTKPGSPPCESIVISHRPDLTEVLHSATRTVEAEKDCSGHPLQISPCIPVPSFQC